MATKAKTILATDFQSLSAFRIVFAAVLLADYCFNILPYFRDFYTDAGVLPSQALALDPDPFPAAKFWRELDHLGISSVLPVLYPLALVFFAIGYRTRIANAIVLVLNTYLFWRNTLIASAAEDLERLLLLWCLFLPMNRYWSVDAALDPSPRDRPYPALPFLAIRAQISSVYVFAGLFKLAGRPWLDGSAVALALSDDMFGARLAGLYLVEHHPGLLSAITYLTIAFQVLHPLLVYFPWKNDWFRGATLAGTALMHISFIFCLNVGMFPYVCLAMLLVLVPDEWWNNLLRRRREHLAGIRIFYDPDCGFCQRVSLLFREFLLSPSAAVLPANRDPEAFRLLTAHNSWVVRGLDGVCYLKWRAMAYLLRQNPMFALVGWLTDIRLLRKLMAHLYDFIGRKRHRLGLAARWLLPLKIQGSLGVPAQALCAVLAILALMCNFSTVEWSALHRPPSVSDAISRPKPIPVIYEAFQIGQRWSLFAPAPDHLQHQFRVLGYRADGSTINVMEHLPVPLVYTGPNGRGVIFANHRWLKYFSRLDQFNEEEWSGLGQYLCKRAGDHGEANAVRKIEIAVFLQSAGEVWKTHTSPVARHVCDCIRARSVMEF